MSQEYPPLALDDLVHFMSPSPAPQTLFDDSDMPPRTQSTSPDPLPESDIVQMRRKVMEICHNDKADARLSPREKELAEMVLRLTTVVGPGPDQLFRQAEMISTLIQQRDLLLHQFEEQRLRWNSEKDGWARMAEALLAQQAKNRFNLERDEDSERLHITEAENKGLRQRLNESQSRLQMLESELTRLRPLLLMQPLISCSSLPPPTPNPKTRYARRRKKTTAITEDEDHAASENEPPGDPHETSSFTPHSRATPKPKSRKAEANNSVNPLTNPHKRRPSQKAMSRGLSADARVEHLLLAARRIGKHRAGIMAGMVHHLEESERERKREESATTAVASTPKTPKRSMPYTGYPPEGGYVYLNSQIRPGPGIQPVPMFIPAYPHHLLQTPSSSTTAPSVTSSAQQSAQKSKQDAKTNNPPTPLDSLLSAARSMMREDIDEEVDEDEEIDVVGDSPGQTPGARQVRSEDMLGSPIPKKRKIAVRPEKLTALHESASRTTDNIASPASASNACAGRVRSALDVLADQAAAFSTQEHSIMPPQTQLPIEKKRKGKERAEPQPPDPSTLTTKSRGRPKSRRKEPEADASSSALSTSRSRTPRSDVGDNTHGSAPTQQPQVGGPSPEAQVDPGGETNIANTSQMLEPTLVSERNVPTNNDAQGPVAPEMASRVDDSADATPRQGFRIWSTPSDERPDDTYPTSNSPHLPVSSMSNDERGETSPLPRAEASPSGGENNWRPGTTSFSTLAKNKELVRITEQDAASQSAKRQRSPYVKWSKEEDDLLTQAVAKYGQKWDLVQKALPSRGYHQVRQRWLRKLGVFDSKPDLSSFQTAATTFSPTSRGDGVELRGNLKLGLAPLSSEKAYSGLVARPPSLPS